MNAKYITALGAIVVAGFGVLGCNKSAEKTLPNVAPAVDTSSAAEGHAGWWCNEHGVPEEVCALCSTKLAAGFKANGDWCKDHDRPESQCFVCHPEKEAEFAAQYEAKFGKAPPKAHDADEHAHDDNS